LWDGSGLPLLCKLRARVSLNRAGTQKSAPKETEP
jgi:hypothetical protein